MTLRLSALAFTALAGFALAPRPARAQAKPTAADPGEAELPDVNAMEKGARPRASVSFGSPLVPAASLGEGGDGTVRTIRAPDSATAAPNGVYGLDAAPAPAGEGPGGPVPEQHVVKKGDTLWSLCGLYFNDPWRWPRLWAQNPQVTNPHWIFPDDVLRLRDAGAPAIRPNRSGMRISTNRQGSLDSKAVMLRELGFVEAAALADSGQVTGSREEKLLLSAGDQAYVGFPKDRPLHAGERYTVFVADTDHPVLSPDNGKVLGYLVRIHGDIVVDQIAEGNVARGMLVDVVAPIERGYSVSARVNQWKRLEPVPSEVNVQTRIVASFSPTIMLATESFVVLSAGGKAGLQVGNRGFVIRRGDGQRAVMEDWDRQDPNYPKDVVAELWILDVKDNASVAWVAHASKELRVGEVTELRRGH
jgi:hypothetical protein